MRTKSPQKKINSQIKKPHLKRIPNKDNYVSPFYTNTYIVSNRFGFGIQWYINLHGLSKAKAIILE